MTGLICIKCYGAKAYIFSGARGGKPERPIINALKGDKRPL
jgi:hypothetical protein